MKSWSAIEIPTVKNLEEPLKVFSTQTQSILELPRKSLYQMYVCGITPYDATHLGHAATYLTFDIIHRYWLALGAKVNYIQNITDIDDPLLERAKRDGVDWRELAHSQIDLFRSDMEALRILPPTFYEGAVHAIPDVIDAIKVLDSKGAVYKVDEDKYFEVHKDSDFGEESHLSEQEMFEIFAERGGDPKRNGKKDPLDPLLWLAKREGEPSWPSDFGEGRPGWHIECAAIALKFVQEQQGEHILDIQGGGQDLIFPHHEMSASQIKVMTGKPFAKAYVHAALIGLDGEKMSKSKGNLVFVSQLIKDGVSPMAIRWALLKRPYDQDYIWKRTETAVATAELERLRSKLGSDSIPSTVHLIKNIYSLISNNLQTAEVIRQINDWVEIEGSGGDKEELLNVLDALLGITLSA